MRRVTALSMGFALVVAPAVWAQAPDPQVIARAEALDACAGRPVVSAEITEGGRLRVVCAENGEEVSRPAGNGLSGLGGGGIGLLSLLFLGALAGGGGGSSGGTN